MKKNLLNESEIDFYVEKRKRHTQILKQIEIAKNILKTEDGKAFIKELNELKNFKTVRNEKGEITSRGLKQFLDSSAQRDSLVAAWIVLSSKDESIAEELGIQLQDKNSFKRLVSDLVKETREAALELDKKNPSPEEVKQFSKEKTTKKSSEKEAPDKDEEEAPKKAPDRSVRSRPEEESEEDDGEGSSRPEEEESEEEAPDRSVSSRSEEEDEEEDDERGKEDNTSSINDLENARSSALEKLEKRKQENPTKGQQRAYDTAEEEIESIYKEYLKKLKMTQEKHKFNPRKNRINSKNLFLDADLKMKKAFNKFARSTLESAAHREIRAAVGVGSSAVKGFKGALKKAKQSNIGRATAEVAKKGVDKAKEAVDMKIKKDKAIKIFKILGPEKNKEYVALLQNRKEEEAEKIWKEAEEEARKKKIGNLDQTKKPEEKPVSTTISTQNESLKRYTKTLNEFIKKEEEKKTEEEALSIAKSSLGLNAAKDYQEKMKGDIKQKEEAIEILKKAKEEEKKKKKDLGLEDKEKELKERILSVIKSQTLYN